MKTNSLKKTNLLNLLSPVALALVLAAVAGCASGNYQKGADTSAKIIASADKITASETNITATVAALNDLVNVPQGDLVPKFANYNSCVNDLQTMANDINKRVDEMSKTGKVYFDTWDQQIATINNTDIKNASSQRKAAVMAQFTDIKRSYLETKMAFDPFMSDLKDVQTALSNDLTVGGVSSVKSAADKASGEAIKLKTSMDKLAGQFRDLGTAMAASGPAPQTGTVPQ
jgi:hypothetical protein